MADRYVVVPVRGGYAVEDSWATDGMGTQLRVSVETQGHNDAVVLAHRLNQLRETYAS